MGCVVRNLPLALEGSASSSFWKSFAQLPQEQRPHHRVEFEWRHWGAPTWGRALIFSNMPEITTVRREALMCTPQNSVSSASLAGYPVAFATALAEVFISGLTDRQLPCLNPARINKAARVAAMQQPRGALAEVVPEWKLVVYVLLPSATVTDPFERQTPTSGMAGTCRSPGSARPDHAAYGLTASVANSDRGGICFRNFSRKCRD